MTERLLRMVEELNELDKKIHNLSLFLQSDDFDSLDIGEQMDMCTQVNHMDIYYAALMRRIHRMTDVG